MQPHPLKLLVMCIENLIIFHVKLTDDEIEDFFNGELTKLCGRCSIEREWEIIGEKKEMDFCDNCNHPAILNYVR